MKKLFSIALSAALISIATGTASAQTNAPAPGTNAPAENPISLLSAAKTYTNIVIIPYAKYDLQSHKTGWGAAALYRVTDNFYSGLRVDRINGYQSTAGVQAQLQANVKVFDWLNTHPFAETSVGIGSSSLYGSAGPGIAIDLLKKDFAVSGHTVHLFLDPIADYEHVVQNGNDSGQSKNSNQFNIGILGGLNF